MKLQLPTNNKTILFCLWYHLCRVMGPWVNIMKLWNLVYPSRSSTFNSIVVLCHFTHASKVWRQDFWMGHHGCPCPKRTSTWSNDETVISRLVSGLIVCKLNVYCSLVRDHGLLHAGHKQSMVIRFCLLYGTCYLEPGQTEQEGVQFDNRHHSPNPQCNMLQFLSWICSSPKVWLLPGRYVDLHGQARFQGSKQLRESGPGPWVKFDVTLELDKGIERHMIVNL